MKRQDFYYPLPEYLIAQYPNQDRSASRLLYLNKETGGIEHHIFRDIVNFLNPGDLLVFNNTKVIPARLLGKKPTGGKVEILIERPLSAFEALAHIRASKTPKAGASLLMEKNVSITVLGRVDDLFHIRFDTEEPLITSLEKYGHMPLPPYIHRQDNLSDTERYQTVYAKHKGSVAAPTAGLHFDETLLNKLKEKSIHFSYVTLHVGAGTFQPIRVDDITEHRMHHEWISVPQETCDAISNTKSRGGRVIAVGTTSVRCLETAAQKNNTTLKAYTGETNIFIYPGYTFLCVDGLITNFHLPESTLLMLVSALAGYKNIMHAYKVAVENEYRFFSYGDAMLILD